MTMISCEDIRRELEAGTLEHIEIVQAPPDHDPAGSKTCSWCGELLPVSAYPRHGTRCRGCAANRQRQLKQESKDGLSIHSPI